MPWACLDAISVYKFLRKTSKVKSFLALFFKNGGESYSIEKYLKLSKVEKRHSLKCQKKYEKANYTKQNHEYIVEVQNIMTYDRINRTKDMRVWNTVDDRQKVDSLVFLKIRKHIYDNMQLLSKNDFLKYETRYVIIMMLHNDRNPNLYQEVLAFCDSLIKYDIVEPSTKAFLFDEYITTINDKDLPKMEYGGGQMRYVNGEKYLEILEPATVDSKRESLFMVPLFLRIKADKLRLPSGYNPPAIYTNKTCNCKFPLIN